MIGQRIKRSDRKYDGFNEKDLRKRFILYAFNGRLMFCLIFYTR